MQERRSWMDFKYSYVLCWPQHPCWRSIKFLICFRKELKAIKCVHHYNFVELQEQLQRSSSTECVAKMNAWNYLLSLPWWKTVFGWRRRKVISCRVSERACGPFYKRTAHKTLKSNKNVYNFGSKIQYRLNSLAEE